VLPDLPVTRAHPHDLMSPPRSLLPSIDLVTPQSQRHSQTAFRLLAFATRECG
jgi:hypothetical protein